MTMLKRFDITDIDVCEVCIHLIANGEYNDGEDTAERCAAGQGRTWGANVRHLTYGGDDLGYSQYRCEGCGNSDHGNRFRAHVMIPINDSEAN